MNKQEIEKFRKEIPLLSEKIYLDNAAMGALHNTVVNRIQNFHIERQVKGSNFPAWWGVVEETRKLIANWINAKPEEITYLWNTTAGINVASQGLELTDGDEVIIPDKEFPANIYPWLALKEKGVKTKIVPFENNELTAEHIIAMVTERTKVISVSWVSATNGNKIDIQTLGRYCKENNIFFVVDAIQGFAITELDLAKCHVDLLVSGFYKWAMGPDGVSFVYINEKSMDKLKMPWVGWASMENPFEYERVEYLLSKSARRYETGNMNFSAISGVNETLSLLQPMQKEIYHRVAGLTKRLRKGIDAIPSLTLLSPTSNESGITLFSGRGIETFERNNFKVNFRSGIRVSPHFYNTEEEIDRFLNQL